MRVLKFGGSSLSTPEKIKDIAQKLALLYKSGEKLIVVTSAMGATTDELYRLAFAVSDKPASREMDMLMSTGERVTMALLCMALHDLDCTAISFTGSQAGIMTNSSHQDADIIEVKPVRIDEALSQNKIVVLAGYQGVDPQSKEITTLGRGGSDTTAVAMASHYQAQCCEMYKDVDGVFNTDPHKDSSAQLMKSMSAQQLLELCEAGAQVVHERAIKMALLKKIEIAIGNSANMKIGTRVTV